MDYHNRGIFFSDEILPQIKPTTNVPNKLNRVALLSLPFIGTLCGVDELCPTKCVYAIYDPSTSGLRFVHGDGVFVAPEQVCFLRHFQHRAFLPLLKERSVWHYRQLCQDNNGQYLRELQSQFVVTEASVKAALIYKSDLRSYIGRIPALAHHISNPEMHRQKPSIRLNAEATWNFDVRRVPCQISREQGTFLKEKYAQFVKKYSSALGEPDFRQALFYLTGLHNAKLISFVQVGDNDRRYFMDGQTPPRPPKNRLPMTTSRGWTVDCFIARFCKFELEFVDNGSYVRVPNPILWLEAQLEDERRRHEKSGTALIKPWKGRISGAQDAEVVPPVLDWKTLLALDWVKSEAIQYPKPFVGEESQGLSLHDIIDPKSGRFKESKKAKRDRKEKEKAAKTARSEIVDLTNDSDDDLFVDHMHQSTKRQASQGDRYEDVANSSNGGAQNERKRKLESNRSEGLQSPQSTTQQAARAASNSVLTIADIEEEEEEDYGTFIRRVKLERQRQLASKKHGSSPQHLPRIKADQREEDIYDDSGARKRLRRHSPSPSPSPPLPQFKNYGGYDEAVSPIKSARAHSHSNSPSTSSSSKFKALGNRFERSLQFDGPPQTPNKGNRGHSSPYLMSPPATNKCNNFKFDSRSSAHLISEEDVLSDDEIERISNPAVALPPRRKKNSPVVPPTPTRSSLSVRKLQDPFSPTSAQVTKGSSPPKALTSIIHGTAVYQSPSRKPNTDKRSPIQQACDVFESQHRLLPRDSRIAKRMKSPTPTSSEEGPSMKIQPPQEDNDKFVDIDAIQYSPVVKAGARVLRESLKEQAVVAESVSTGANTAVQEDEFMDIVTFMTKNVFVASSEDSTAKKAGEERPEEVVNGDHAVGDGTQDIKDGFVDIDAFQPSTVVKAGTKTTNNESTNTDNQQERSVQGENAIVGRNDVVEEEVLKRI